MEWISFANRFVLPLLLFGIFFYFFGLSTLQKESAKDVVVVRIFTLNNFHLLEKTNIHLQVRKQRKNPGLVPPALTVCAWSKKEFGWKNATEMVTGGLDTICDAGKNLEEMNKCVKEKTYSLEETVDNSYWWIIATPTSDRPN